MCQLRKSKYSAAEVRRHLVVMHNLEERNGAGRAFNHRKTVHDDAYDLCCVLLGVLLYLFVELRVRYIVGFKEVTRRFLLRITGRFPTLIDPRDDVERMDV